MCSPLAALKMDTASDVRGFILNHFGQGIVLPLLLFIITTFLRILNQAAGCTASGETCANKYALQAYTNTTNSTIELAPSPPPGNNDTCGKVWGFRPASLVSFLMTVGSLTIAALMPVVGSVVDHSTYRRAIGRSSVCVIWACCAAGVAVGKHTWQALIIFQIVVLKVAFMTNVTCVMSYMPELTVDLGDGLAPVSEDFLCLRIDSKLRKIICADIRTGCHKLACGSQPDSGDAMLHCLHPFTFDEIPPWCRRPGKGGVGDGCSRRRSYLASKLVFLDS